VPASDRIDELKKRFDENPRRFFASLANEYRKSGDLEQAIAICQAHLADQPSNMNGHVVYGQALFEAGRYDEARTTFETALTLDPENLIALRHLGDIACTNGQNDAARTWYERVLDADPRNEEITALLATLDDAPASAPLSAADPTPVVPLDAVKTVQTPAVRSPAPPRESIGLLDLSTEFETTADSPKSDAPAAAPAPDFDEISAEFAGFGSIEPEPVAEATFAPPAEPDSDLIDAFSDFPDAPAPVAAVSEEAPEPADATQPEPPAAPFVTETMAELYLQQGFNAEALDVYRQLSAAYPNDEKLRERVRKLERGERTSLSLEVVPDGEASGVSTEGIVHDLMPERSPVADRAPSSGATVRSYFAGLAARRAVQGNGRARTTPVAPTPQEAVPSVAAPATPDAITPSAVPASSSLDTLFAGTPVARDDEEAALAFAQVAGAVEMGSVSVRGKPTAPASSELSLDAVFRAAEPRPSATVSRQSQTLRFDQFFATGGDEGDASAVSPDSTPAGEPGSPAELQQFQSWLTGLKRP